MQGRRLPLVIALTLAGSGAGCSRALPPDGAAANLYRDLERLVSVETAAGWHIDRVELEGLLPEALMSVCRVPEPQRRALDSWLEARIASSGGPVEEAWARSGSLDEVSALLELTRIRMLLAYAEAASTADCPFWLRPDPAFRGRQISDDRWQISFGGGGKGIFVYQEDQADIYFGGAGRLLFGRNFGDRWAIYAGGEAGASASFPRDEMGERGALVLGLDFVFPAVVRYQFVNTYVEVEAGYLTRVTEDDLLDFEHGMHVGLSMGGRATRKRWFFPGAAFTFSYERTFPDGDDATLQTLKLGFRVAIDMDL